MLSAEDLFNESFYLANNPDVQAAVEAGIIDSGFEHFIETGQFQVRQPSPLYDESYYLTTNPIVAEAVNLGFFTSGFQHYIEFGQFQFRNPSVLFDTEFYLTQNPGVQAAVEEGILTGIEHFVKFGQFENRSPSLLYNPRYYIAQNPDAAVAVERDQVTGIQYYLDVGASLNQDFTPFIPPNGSTFPNRVAVGDVTQTSAVLWTRTTVPGNVSFELATDPNFNTIFATLNQSTPDPLVPIKLPVGNLIPGTQYFYRVKNGVGATEVGSFRTAAPLGTQTGLRFGVSGTIQGELAPYPAIVNVPERNLDFFVQLGDTIYADSISPDLPQVRQASTSLEFDTKYNETISERAALNSWANLASSTPIYAVWDDHDIVNNFAGGSTPAQNIFTQALFGTEGQFVNETPLFKTALQSFQDYKPLQDQFYGETGDPRTANKPKLSRTIVQGNDAASFILDVRSFRDQPLFPPPKVPTSEQVDQFLAQTFTPNRTILGTAQLEDLKQDLLNSENAGITWKFIFSPVPMQNLGIPEAEDRWEGYAAERTDLLQFIVQNNIENVVFVSGEINGTVVNNLTYQTGFDQPQIPTGAFEVTVGPTAVQLDLGTEFLAAPLGPATIELTPDDLLSPDAKAVYNNLDTRPVKDDFIQDVIDNRIVPLGYDSIGLENSGIDAQLIEGSYVSAHTFGWTEFVINPQTQQLTVTTYGIEPYTTPEVESIPAIIINRQPEVITQFIVNPV